MNRWRFRRFLLCLICALLIGAVGLCLATESRKASIESSCAFVTFSAAKDFPAGINAYRVVVADFNQDGEADIAVANGASNFISVLLGSGTGNFAPAANLDLTSRSLVVADFNKDGKPDLASAGAGPVSVFIGNGLGGFTLIATMQAGSDPNFVAAGDFNRDGNPDLVAVNFSSDNVSVFSGNGTGTFSAAQNIAVAPAGRAVTIGDFNGDGKQDLVVVSQQTSANNSTVLLGDGAGGFASPVFFKGGPAPYKVLSGDFNGDNKLDLATTSTGTISILTGNGTGGFGPLISMDSTPEAVAIADINKDGKADLIGVSNTLNLVRVLFGNGAAGFSPSPDLIAGGEPIDVAVGDFDDDGNPDLASANFGSNDVSILRGAGNGSFTSAASHNLRTPLSRNSATSIATGDFDADGHLDLAVTDSVHSSVSFLFGRSDGTFETPVARTVVSMANWLCAEDLNGDGRADLAVAGLGSSAVALLFSDGNRTFSEGALTVAGSGRFVTQGDLNNDGKPDLIVGTSSPHRVSAFLGNGAGGFTNAGSISFNGEPYCVASGDLDGDGKKDLVVATIQQSGIRIVLGDGNGGLNFTSTLNVGSDPMSVAIGDVNLDGKQDIVVTPNDGSRVAVLLGDGHGAFGTASFFPVGIFPRSVAVIDLNGDGQLDLAVCNEITNDLSLLKGDGSGGFVTAATYGLGAGPRAMAIGDFNGDGRPDIASANYGSGSATVLLSKSCESEIGRNPIDISRIFVRQQYLDFLSREPDQGGWDYWTDRITQCGSDLLCEHHRRIEVSAAFFIELEFQETGSVVYRLYRAAYGTLPNAPTRANLTYAQFNADRAQLIGGSGLPQSTINFANAFVQRSAFKQLYPDAMPNADFVNALFDRAGLTGSANAALRQAEISAMTNNGKTRAQVLLDVIDVQEFKDREYNRSFVLMQYFGYLRRDAEPEGYDFWLDVLNNRLPNDVSGYRAMVCGFITSTEYQLRFGTSITRSNADCSQ